MVPYHLLLSKKVINNYHLMYIWKDYLSGAYDRSTERAIFEIVSYFTAFGLK